MTSKNYLFNSIKENIRRNFSLLILLSVAMLAVLPAYTLMSLDVAKIQESMQGELISPVQQELLECLGMGNPGLMVVVIFSAVLLGLTGFSYLHSGEKTDFYHSLPLKREELFVSSFFSGFFTFLLPYLGALALTCLIGGGYGGFCENTTATLFKAMGIHILFFLLIYSISILALLLTGNLFTALLAFLGIMTYGWLVSSAYSMLNNRFLYTFGAFEHSDIGKFLSPVISYLALSDTFHANLLLKRQPMAFTQVHGDASLGTKLIIFAVILTILALIADICLYKIRPSESYHKAIAFRKLQPAIKVACVLPIALLAGLLFSAGMGNSFLWLVLSTLVVGLLLSIAFEFLYTMDIRKSLRPRISSGLSLGLLILIMAGYKTDVTGFDSYLPKKEQIETMSVYFPSINGRFSYDNDYFDIYNNVDVNFLEKPHIRDFDSVYALAKEGIKACKERKKQDSVSPILTMTENNAVSTTGMDYLYPGAGNDTTLVSVNVAFHLKSGKTVYRSYLIPETEKVIAQIADIYDDWDYREKLLPTSYQKVEDISYLYLHNFYEYRKQLDMTKGKIEELYKTYKTELENMTFQESSEKRIIGYLEAESEHTDTWNNRFSTSYSLPIYENFAKTIRLLEDAGEEVPKAIDPDKIEKLTLSVWDDELGEESIAEVEDAKQIQQLLEHLSFESCRYGVNSPLDYRLNVSITWKNQENDMTSLYLMKDKSVEEILKKLKFD